MLDIQGDPRSAKSGVKLRIRRSRVRIATGAPLLTQTIRETCGDSAIRRMPCPMRRPALRCRVKVGRVALLPSSGVEDVRLDGVLEGLAPDGMGMGGWHAQSSRPKSPPCSLRGEGAIFVLSKSLIIRGLYFYWPLLRPPRTISEHLAKPAPGIHLAARVLPRAATIPFRESSRRRAFTSPRSIDSATLTSAFEIEP